MDHGGQFEREGKVMSQLQVGGVDLCDNLPSSEALTAQTPNLNETNTLTQTQSHSPSQNEDGGGRGLIQKAALINNEKNEEDEQGEGGYKGIDREEDEEEDTDELMKEEEDESEGSSCQIHCQSPDTPMTDSSYSETGSLLETPYPFSPATTPEPTSPVIPVVSPETAYPISPVELSQSDAEVDFDNSNNGSVVSIKGSTTCTLGPAFTTGPIDSTTLTVTSDTRLTSTVGPACITEATARIAKNTNSATEHLTSSTESGLNHGPTCTRGPISSHAEPITSTAEIFTVTACTTSLDTSIASSPMSAPTGPIIFTSGPTGATTTGTESTSTSTSNWEHITSTPVLTCFSVSTGTTGPIPSPALLASLDQLAQRGDDAHLPQYLHQIAEAFVHHEDYQRALWCIMLERLYHQRVLDNLNALQEQWESQCRRTSSDLATQHLDTLRNICQTHSRPRAGDAVCASLDILRPTFDEGVALPSCTSAHQIEGGMEQRAEDSSHAQSSHPVTPSINLADRLNSPEKSEKDREEPDSKLEGRAGFHGTRLSDREGSDREVGGAPGYTISTRGNGLHPSTAGEMDQSKPAEQQGGDLGPVQEKEAKKEEEERDVEEAAEALEMEDEAEEEEEEEQKERDSPFCQKALPVETLVSGAEVEEQQLHQEALAEETLQEEIQLCQGTQESNKTCLHQESLLPQEAHMKQQEQGEEGGEEEEEEEEEEEYKAEQTDIIRQAASLDDMAKLITVEELSPASGLVSILKKRSVNNINVSASSESRPDNRLTKRRVRFKVPDDSYEQDIGGGDSCLLLFLLCMVTVVISVGGTALYCALGDAHSSVCQDFSRNADFYIGQIQRGIAQIQYWFTLGS